MLEAIQFQVTLTKDPRILKQLKINRMQREDVMGPYFSVQFDGQEFKFRPGQLFTVGKTIGNALIRSSAVLIGIDPLSDPYFPFVEKVKEVQLGQADVQSIKKSQFACPICGENMKSGPKLARHLMDKNAHKEDAQLVDEYVDDGDASDGSDEAGGDEKVETRD